MEQTKTINPDAYLGIKLEEEEAIILQKFEDDTRERARLVGKLISEDSSDEKVAVALIRCAIAFMSSARGDVLYLSAKDVESFDALLSNIFKKADSYIKECSELYCRIYSRCKDQKMSDMVDDENRKKISAIAEEETDKYYAEKKDNDPEAD